MNLGLALIGKAMLNKSLIFLLLGGAVFLRGVVWPEANHGGLKGLMPGLLYSVLLTPWQATVDPCLCRRLPDTHRQVWLSLLWGYYSFSWFLVSTNVLFVSFKSLFP